MIRKYYTAYKLVIAKVTLHSSYHVCPSIRSMHFLIILINFHDPSFSDFLFYNEIIFNKSLYDCGKLDIQFFPFTKTSFV